MVEEPRTQPQIHPGKRFYFTPVWLFFLLVMLTGCSGLPVEDSSYLMGTQVTITIYDYDKDRLKYSQLQGAIEEGFLEIARVENLAHRNQLHRLNSFAGSQAAAVGQETIDLVDHAYQLSMDTRRAFRPDLGPLIKLWGIGTDEERIPAYWEIEDKLELVIETVFLVEDSVLARLDPFGASLDLGGVAKGYAVDRACEVLQDVGVTAGMVWAGGDLKVFGRKPDREPWRVAVRHPRNPDEFAAVLELYEDMAVATSGDYERYFEVDGIRYHHILDPWTGYPAINAISATAVAKMCTDADAYATAFFVLGPEAGVELAYQLDVPAQVMDEREGVIVEEQTPSFERLRAENEAAMVE